MKKIDVLQPTYFSRFSCLGAECRYHCCQEWNIFLNKSEYTKIKSRIHSKELEDTFCDAFVRRRQKEGDDNRYASAHYNQFNTCRLQNAEGMCSLQLQCGHQALPSTCQTFPRMEALLLGSVERHLSLGCEGVVKLLLEERQGICMEADQLSPNRKVHMVLYLSKQDVETRPIYQFIWDVKTLCAAVLQDRSRSMDDRMVLLGVMLRRIHQMETENRTEQIPALVDEVLHSEDDYLNLTDWESVELNPSLPILNALIFLNQLKAVSSNPHLIHMVEELLQRFQIVIERPNETSDRTDETSDRIDETLERTDENTVHFTMNQEKNQKIKKNWDQWLAQYDYFVENIMVAWFFQEQLPFSKKGCSIWEHYIYFCSLYNLLKIILMGTVSEPDWDMDQVIHHVTVCARSVTHSAQVSMDLMKRAVDSGSDTLAHMFLLIKS